MNESSTSGRANDLTPLLRELKALRARLRALHLAFGLSRLVLVAAVVAALTFILDRSLDLPRGVRLVLFSTSAATIVFVVYRYLAYPLTRRFTDIDLARAVEDRFPELHDSVLSALELSEAARSDDYPDSRALVAAVVAEARRRVESVPISRIADRAKVGRAALAAALPAVVVAAGAIASPELASIWVQRMLALRDVPWPRRTWLEVIPFKTGKNLTWERRGDTIVINVPRGTDLSVVVKANGVVPPTVEIAYWTIEDESGDAGTRDIRQMARVGDRDFSHQFVALTRSFRFTVQGGDDRDGVPLFLVNVKTPPKIESIRLDVRPPAYTGEAATTRADGNLEAPEGTDVDLLLTTNLDVKTADLLTLADGSSRALEKIGPRRFRGSFTVERTTAYTVSLEAEDGLTNMNPVRYYLRAIPDVPPKIRIQAPVSIEVDGTPDALVPIRADVSDDYGISRVALLVRGGRATEDVELPFPPELVTRPDGEPRTGAEKRLVACGEIDLRAVAGTPIFAASPDGAEKAPRPGDTIRFRVEARDNRTEKSGQPSPNVERSQEIRVSVITKAELERKLNDWQLRLKEDVKKVLKNQKTRLEKLDGVMVSLGTPDGPSAGGRGAEFPGRTDILDLEVAQNRITSELRRVQSDFLRISDLYIYNRVENTTVGERMLRTLLALSRRAETTLDAYRQLMAEASGGTYAESELLQKLLAMLAIVVESAETRSPAVANALATARNTIDPEIRLDHLRTAKDEGQKVVQGLELLLKKMDEWEDFQEVLQITREILDFQKAIKARTVEELEQKTKPSEERR